MNDENQPIALLHHTYPFVSGIFGPGKPGGFSRVGLVWLLLMVPWSLRAQDVYDVTSGMVHFHSDAPVELIGASSGKLSGHIDTKSRTFSFKINISSFSGFKCHLMANRFNKDFMESSKYPDALFTGKIIDDLDLSKPGAYSVRAKGKLNIHGLEQERVIRVIVISKNGVLTIESDLVVELADHHIQVPRALFQAIASEIQVSVRATLMPHQAVSSTP